MAARKGSSLDRVLGRLDNLDSVNLTNLVQRLARDRDLFETVFNCLREGVLIVGSEAVVEYANQAAMRMIALPENEIGVASLWKFLPDLARTLDRSEDGMPALPPSLVKELHLTYPENRYVRLYMVPFHGSFAEDEHGRYAVILSDITQEKASTEQLVESERISSILLFAAGVAHEIGNPMNSITIHIQLMQRQLAKMRKTSETARIGKGLEVCSAEVKRLNDIVTHFLHAIRPVPLDLQEVNLIEVLEEVLHVQVGELDNREIEADIEVAENLPMIMGDRNQLKQVFFNLVKNAMEAMPSGGHLKIRARADDENLYLQVGDSGVGISQEDISRVFDPYFTTKKSGHGLGLMIVQRIMRDHGGHVSVESREGVGTVVSLQFPQKDRRVRLLRG